MQLLQLTALLELLAPPAALAATSTPSRLPQHRASLKADDGGTAVETHKVITNKQKPNILHILLDDFGWADAGWHRSPGYTDLQSPNMDALVRGGIELDRHYVFQFCSPTRCAMQTGCKHGSTQDMVCNVTRTAISLFRSNHAAQAQPCLEHVFAVLPVIMIRATQPEINGVPAQPPA